jgi:hypothetical protein
MPDISRYMTIFEQNMDVKQGALGLFGSRVWDTLDLSQIPEHTINWNVSYYSTENGHGSIYFLGGYIPIKYDERGIGDDYEKIGRLSFTNPYYSTVEYTVQVKVGFENATWSSKYINIIPPPWLRRAVYKLSKGKVLRYIKPEKRRI